MSPENPYAPVQVAGQRQSSKVRSDLLFYFATSTIVLLLIAGWTVYKVRSDSLRIEDGWIVIESNAQSPTSMIRTASLIYMNFPVGITLIAIVVAFANGLVWFALTISRFLKRHRSVALE